MNPAADRLSLATKLFMGIAATNRYAKSRGRW
jgi:hypothetical protein